MKQLFLVISCAFLLLHVQAQNCPTSITVTAPSEAIANTTFQFIVQVKGLSSSSDISYNWSISYGTIVSGQGTPVITVDPGKEAGSCTATLELGGLPNSCNRTASSTTDIKWAPEKILTTNVISNKAIQDAVKSFIDKSGFKDVAILQDGLINIYAANTQEFNKIKTMIDKAFESNLILSYQYTIVNTGIKKPASVEMFRTKKSY